MAMSRFKTLTVNQVNLGSLYSLSQRGALLMGGPPTISAHRCEGFPSHGVNLGDLYKGDRYHEYPQGWAYFENGSIFVARSSYDHQDFQRAMNILAPFVRNPSGTNSASEREGHRRMQMIVLEKRSHGGSFALKQYRLLARYASAAEKFFAPTMSFRPLFMMLDPTMVFPVVTDWEERVLPGSTFVKHEQDLAGLLESLRTFRGTLYDGVLQPNVRPSNGLDFLTDPPPNMPSQASPLVQKESTLEQGLALLESHPRAQDSRANAPRRGRKANRSKDTIPRNIDIVKSHAKRDRKRERQAPEAAERAAKAEMNSILELINRDDTLPTDALELLRKTRQG